MRLVDIAFKIIDRIALVFKPCDHMWEFSHIEYEQNLRSGHDHDSHIYRCVFCKERWIEEQSTSSKNV